MRVLYKKEGRHVTWSLDESVELVAEVCVLERRERGVADRYLHDFGRPLLRPRSLSRRGRGLGSRWDLYTVVREVAGAVGVARVAERAASGLVWAADHPEQRIGLARGKCRARR